MGVELEKIGWRTSAVIVCNQSVAMRSRLHGKRCLHFHHTCNLYCRRSPWSPCVAFKLLSPSVPDNDGLVKLTWQMQVWKAAQSSKESVPIIGGICNSQNYRKVNFAVVVVLLPKPPPITEVRMIKPLLSSNNLICSQFIADTVYYENVLALPASVSAVLAAHSTMQWNQSVDIFIVSLTWKAWVGQHCTNIAISGHKIEFHHMAWKVLLLLCLFNPNQWKPTQTEES